MAPLEEEERKTERERERGEEEILILHKVEKKEMQRNRLYRCVSVHPEAQLSSREQCSTKKARDEEEEEGNFEKGLGEGIGFGVFQKC